jgi:hypothetical protein
MCLKVTAEDAIKGNAVGSKPDLPKFGQKIQVSSCLLKK